MSAEHGGEATTTSDPHDLHPSARWRTIRVVLDIGMGPKNFRNGRGLDHGSTLADGVADYVRRLVLESEAVRLGELDIDVRAVHASDAPRSAPLAEDRAVLRAAIESGRASWWVGWMSAGPLEYHGPWWRSGAEVGGAGRSTFVAAVKAADEDAARRVIVDAHDEPAPPVEWRFVEARSESWDPFASDRFPRAQWMQWPVSGRAS